MSNPTPLALIAGLSLILIGLVYPFIVLWRLNRQLGGEEVTANRQLAVTLALAALVPLTAVLAGFWILVPAARSSLTFTAFLFGSGFALVVTLLAGWWINRGAGSGGRGAGSGGAGSGGAGSGGAGSGGAGSGGAGSGGAGSGGAGSGGAGSGGAGSGRRSA